MTTESHVPGESAAGRAGVLSRGFVGLLGTQLFTAINDNIFRWLAIGIGKDFVPREKISFILMVGTASFVLPYLFLAAPAGYLADRFSKRDVIVACKLAEVLLMFVGILAIQIGNAPLLFAVLALLGAQSALFSPAKIGSIPEALRPDQISLANGLFGLATVAATVIGMLVGNKLKDLTGVGGRDNLPLTAAVLLGVALAGLIVSLLIPRRAAGNPHQRFPWNAATQTYRDLRLLASNTPMFRVALGMVFFWMLGSLAQLNIDQFALEGGGEQEFAKAPLLASLVLGLGVGSVIAGYWSHGRVELGILPLGATGVAVCSMSLFLVEGQIITDAATWTVGFKWACVLLAGLGVSAGLFSVPLDSFMQHRSAPASRGAILAAANFMVFSGILLSSILFHLLRSTWLTGQPLFSARAIFLLAGISTIPVVFYIIWLIPQSSIRFLVWLASQTVYRLKVVDRDYLPEQGGALVVANHVSFVDAVLLMLTSSRPIRMIAWSGNFESRLMKWLAGLWGVILISGKPKSIVAALKTARQALIDGELVCIFPEGAITRSGQLMGFKPGLLKIVGETEVPIVPVYLDGLWGSIFSFERGKFFWKWPKHWPYPVSVRFGPPVEKRDDLFAIRQAVQDLGANAVTERVSRKPRLVHDFIRVCKRRGADWKIADSLTGEIGGAMLLIRSLILRRLLRRLVLAADERMVGVLLPPSLPGFITNLALALDRRVAVNLNYTVSSNNLNSCIAQAGIRHVLTSRSFLNKMNFELQAEVVCLEDLKDKPTALDKLIGGLSAYALPTGWLAWWLGLGRVEAHDILTVIFTSGSTGEPKGVVLTYGNIAHNVMAIEQAVQLSPSDVIVGVLPFFHSFGYTVTLWAVASLDIKGIYHYSPLDAKQVGKLCKKYGGTVLLSAPTFLRGFVRRCEPDEFKTLDVAVTGAEKLPRDLADAFEQRFGVRPVEGYGTTELSPIVSVNIPPSRSRSKDQVDRKEGTVGRPVEGVSAKVVDLDTGKDLSTGQAGMLWIKGPNVMQGYLGRPDLTAEAIRDGWYVTGDVATIDSDGFITITGRESRFSKIGGEMVPHVRIEEAINKVVNASPDQGLKAVVVAVPDEKKGERLVVIHTKLDMAPDQITPALTTEGLPNLFIPTTDSYFEVDQLPILGTGKLDLKAVKQLALEKTGRSQA